MRVNNHHARLDSSTSDRFGSFILANTTPNLPISNGNGFHLYSAVRPAVTISRETGAGAVSIAGLVAELLSGQDQNATPWNVFDRNLVEEALKEHQLPERLKRFMSEDAMPELRSSFEELLGLHPSSWSLFQTVSETILHLAKAGNVVLVGRGANLITAHLKNVLHVRLIAPVEKRVETVAKLYNLNAGDADAFLRKTDQARARYVTRYFQQRIDDPQQYHLTINTGLISYEAAARLIADSLQSLVLSGTPA